MDECYNIRVMCLCDSISFGLIIEKGKIYDAFISADEKHYIVCVGDYSSGFLINDKLMLLEDYRKLQINKILE